MNTMKALTVILIADEMNPKTARRAPYLLAPGHAVSEVVDEVLTVPFDQAVLHYLVDHLPRALDDRVHGQRQVRPVQLVVNLPGAAAQHVLQAAVFHHGPVAEDGGDAAGPEVVTYKPEANKSWTAARNAGAGQQPPPRCWASLWGLGFTICRRQGRGWGAGWMAFPRSLCLALLLTTHSHLFLVKLLRYLTAWPRQHSGSHRPDRALDLSLAFLTGLQEFSQTRARHPYV